MTMILKLVLESSDETRQIGYLMSSGKLPY
jgi:hypothetical protein